MMGCLLKRFNDIYSNHSIGDGHFVSHRVLAIIVSAFARDPLVITGSKLSKPSCYVNIWLRLSVSLLRVLVNEPIASLLL